MNDQKHFIDAIQAAAQLGRLDLVSLLLAAIGLILVVGGLFAFFNVRSIARKQATEESGKIAKTVEEQIANEYKQKHLYDIVKAYRNMMDSDAVSDDLAKRMADSQYNAE
ncbi:hypothetical protein N9X03_04185 [Planktomarina temperata]|nr:hypothetical protein [Planktomarina temperata]